MCGPTPPQLWASTIGANGPAPEGLYIQPEISGPAALLPTATLGKRTVWAEALPANSSAKAIAISRIMLHSSHKSGETPTMIKTIGLLTRKDGWSHEQFMKHWVEVHAPLAHAVPCLRRYVQDHITGERTRADIPPPPSRSTASPSCGSTIRQRWTPPPVHPR